MEQVKAVIDQPSRGNSSKDEQIDVIRELRDLPPLHYLFKIENFSELHKAKIDHYKSTDFEVGGYKWKLHLYPKGNKKVNEKDHISLYLVLSESNEFTFHQEVNVYLKLFVYNQIQDKYLTVQDAKGRARRFRGIKKEWGFDQLVHLDVFNDASNGYLIDDSCVFGAEVFVLEGSCKVESVSAVKEQTKNALTWKLKNFAELEEEIYTSEVFVVCGCRWRLQVDRDGYSTAYGKCLSAFLCLEDSEVSLDPEHSFYVEYTLRVRDQIAGKHHERFEAIHFDSSFEPVSGSWGIVDLIPLSKLNDSLQGYIVNGTMILEVQISLITMVVYLSVGAQNSTKQEFPLPPAAQNPAQTNSQTGSNNENFGEASYPKGWVIGKKRKLSEGALDEDPDQL